MTLHTLSKTLRIAGFITLAAANTTLGLAQNVESKIASLPNEKWWGGMVGLGAKMPFAANLQPVNLATNHAVNQAAPLLLSSAGRYVWSDEPFAFSLENGDLLLRSAQTLQAVQAGGTLREAFVAACAKHFPPRGAVPGAIPDTLFFTRPQYNTWIELMYDQNQADIMKYAQGVVDNNFPTGVLMVDDNWQKYYGNFEFKPDKFPAPHDMVKALHAQGFRVMLWVCPFVSADSREFRMLHEKNLLIKNSRGEAAIINWWNGYSACYDFSNPEAVKYFTAQLRQMQTEYGIDGFKLDAGDVQFYTDPDLRFFDPKMTAVDACRAWSLVGAEFPFNEYRASWKVAGEPLVQRLADKSYSWNAVRLLLPEMLGAGLLGYAYTCPDMIGGGQFTDFLNIDQTKMNEELIVRSCQVHALMPMMQFSVAPWRILGKTSLDICRRYAQLHQSMSGYILELARNAAATGEPIVRHLEYEFPHQGFAECRDQLMLGSKYLVAPMLEQGNSRQVVLPRGKWKDDRGKIFSGPAKITCDAPLERLIYFEKVK
jgi:alpha-glucosidase